MTPDRWKQLEPLFDRITQLAPGDSEAMLADLSRTDPELADDLRALLAHDGSGGKLVSEAVECIAGSLPAPEAKLIGKRIGPYSIVREIGQGGMGVVFEATRDDDQFRKRVALKVAQRATFYPAFRERFRHERQILAQLEHPNVARLLDGGTTDDGIPFFAMEYVEGVSVDRHVEEKNLGLREQLALFLKICSAVEYAHQNLIVHRDIKPANILITADGVPKLLDFGIAKLLLDNQADSRQTQTGLAPVTPDYCSPEQLRGSPITTRTDVYLLGLLLYEILTGDRAQNADTSTPLALERSICEVELPLASTKAAAKGHRDLAAKLKGDLDTIVSAATRKEPERRYATVAQLAGDIRLHLEGRPISAHPDSFSYRVGKYVRRNWLPLAAAAAFGGVILAGAASTLHQYRKAAHRFDQVRGIARTLMFDIHDSVRVLPTSVPAQELIVNTALAYLDNLERDAAGDATLLNELASGYIRMAEIQGQSTLSHLNNPDAALRHYRKAEQISIDVNRKDPRNEAAAARIVEARSGIAEILVRKGQSSEARSYLDKAIQLIEPLARSEHATVTSKRAWALVHMVRTRDFAAGPEAEQMGRDLVTAIEAQGNEAAATKEGLRELAVGYSVAGGAFVKARNGAEAAPILEKAVAIQEKLVQAAPNNMYARRSLMLAHAKIGDLYTGPAGAKLNQRDKGIASYRRMAEQAEWMHNADPARKNTRFDLAVSTMRLGDAMAAGDPAGNTHLDRAIHLLQELARAEPKDSTLQRQLLDAHLRAAARMKGQAALDHASQAVTIGEQLVSTEPTDESHYTLLIRAYYAAGRVHLGRGHLQGARAAAQKAFAAAGVLGSINPKGLSPEWTRRLADWKAELAAK